MSKLNRKVRKKTAMPVHHMLRRRRAPICQHRPHQNAPTKNRGPHVLHPMAPDLPDYLGRRKVPRCSPRYFRSPPSFTLSAISRFIYCLPHPPHQPGVITPAPPQFPNCYPPTSPPPTQPTLLPQNHTIWIEIPVISGKIRHVVNVIRAMR